MRTRQRTAAGKRAAAKKALARAEQLGKAIQLRLEGKGYEKMAPELGVKTAAAAYKIFAAAVRAHGSTREQREEALVLELQRLDKLWETAWSDLENPDWEARHSAIDRALRVMDRRARMLGLDELRVADFSATTRTSITRLVERMGDHVVAAERIEVHGVGGEETTEAEDDEAEGDDDRTVDADPPAFSLGCAAGA